MTLETFFNALADIMSWVWSCMAIVEFTFGDVIIHPLYLILGFLILSLAWKILGKITDNTITKGD